MHTINRKWWDEVTPIHVRSRFYDVDGFLAGRETLDPIEIEGVGDVRGKTLVHLQCHFGLDSLSWARRGATVTGVDFSPVALSEARALAAKAGLTDRARFLEGDVLDLAPVLDERFDVVFTSYGVINWLPDLNAWARTVARLLKPDGLFFIAEVHPAAGMLEEEGERLCVANDYFHDPAGISLPAEPDYADPTYTSQSDTREWQWSLSDIFAALTDAGLRISSFHEYPFSCFRHFPQMTAGPDGRWRLPADAPQIPLLFSLSARPEFA